MFGHLGQDLVTILSWENQFMRRATALLLILGFFNGAEAREEAPSKADPIDVNCSSGGPPDGYLYQPCFGIVRTKF